MPADARRYEAVIGLEVHLQLSTRTKMFCRCPNRYGAAPNSLVCPVCLGYPGALPVLNRRAVELGTRLALALGCAVHATSEFARKSYFYPDLPKGYQITQYEHPLATGGHLPLTRHALQIGIQRLHLEEDAGKLVHDIEVHGGGKAHDGLDGSVGKETVSGVDFNRAGVPLAEIVSEPQLRTPEQAADYLRSLHQLVRYTEVGDAHMEEGGLRCDANVSLRPVADTSNKQESEEAPFGTRVEVKNLNSFRNVARALAYEIERQTALLEQGGAIQPETRGWSAELGETWVMRDKEDSQDYRYFPDPDLPPLHLGAGYVDQVRRQLPELPWRRRQRLADTLELDIEEAHALTHSQQLADYVDEAIRHVQPELARTVANWVRTEVLREIKASTNTAEEEAGSGIETSAHDVISPRHLAELVQRIADGTLSVSAGKMVFDAIRGRNEAPADVIDRLGLRQVRDEEQLRAWIEAVIDEHPAQVAAYAAGKTSLLGFFVGQVMQRSAGRADPKAVSRLLQQQLPTQAPPDVLDVAADNDTQDPS